MATAATITTAEALARAGSSVGRCELVHGNLVMMSPAGSRHGAVTLRIATRLANHVEAHDLGQVVAAETGFVLGRNPDTVRAPDVALVRRARLEGGLPTGYFPGAPDLAVEVLSPDDRPDAVAAKTADWLAAGTQLVWIADPESRSLVAHRPDGDVQRFSDDSIVSGDTVVPGFSLPLAAVFG